MRTFAATAFAMMIAASAAAQPSRDLAPAVFAPPEQEAAAVQPERAPTPPPAQEAARPEQATSQTEPAAAHPADASSFCTDPDADGNPRTETWTKSCLAALMPPAAAAAPAESGSAEH